MSFFVSKFIQSLFNKSVAIVDDISINIVDDISIKTTANNDP